MKRAAFDTRPGFDGCGLRVVSSVLFPLGQILAAFVVKAQRNVIMADRLVIASQSSRCVREAVLALSQLLGLCVFLRLPHLVQPVFLHGCRAIQPFREFADGRA